MRIWARICIALIFLSFATILILQYRVVDVYAASTIVFVCCIVGMLCCVMGFAVVVLARKKSDEVHDQLQENQQKYKLIISASNTGAWEHHSDTQLEWYSSEYFKMLGYEEDEFLKDKTTHINDIWINLLHPDDKNEAIRRFNEYAESDSSELYENYFRLKHKNGSWIWIWSRGQTLRKPDGTKTTVTLGTHIDVTERKNLEIELLKLNETLLNYAHLNAHKVRGPLARLLGLIEVSRLDSAPDYKWCFEQIGLEAIEVDKVIREITSELSDLEQEKKERLATAKENSNNGI